MYRILTISTAAGSVHRNVSTETSDISLPCFRKLPAPTSVLRFTGSSYTERVKSSSTTSEPRRNDVVMPSTGRGVSPRKRTFDLPCSDMYFTRRPSTPLPILRFTGSTSTERGVRFSSTSVSVEPRGNDVLPTASETVAAVRSTGRQYTLTQLVVAVVVTHVVTLLFYIILAGTCYWRRCSGDELAARRRRRVHHQRSTVWSGSSASTSAKLRGQEYVSGRGRSVVSAGTLRWANVVSTLFPRRSVLPGR